MRTPAYRHIDELRNEYNLRKDLIRMKLAEFTSVRCDDYFYEMIYCMLTPQSSARNAAAVVERLREVGFVRKDVSPVQYLRDSRNYIRFHNSKSRHLVELKLRFPQVGAVLSNGLASRDKREWLVRNVRGLGWKEASHVLRNIGCRNLAILDRHILRNLKYHGVLRIVPASLTRKIYLSIERKFQIFADTIGVPMDELDLLFWAHETGEILK